MHGAGAAMRTTNCHQRPELAVLAALEKIRVPECKESGSRQGVALSSRHAKLLMLPCWSWSPKDFRTDVRGALTGWRALCPAARGPDAYYRWIMDLAVQAGAGRPQDQPHCL